VDGRRLHNAQQRLRFVDSATFNMPSTSGAGDESDEYAGYLGGAVSKIIVH
jgi:hypothetical protein